MKKNNKYYKELRSKNKEEKNNQNTEVDADKEVIAGRNAILEAIKSGREINKNTTLLLLDHIEDPHNLGAIIRSAEASGVKGVIIPKRRAAVVSQTAVKASAGAIEHMPVIRVSSLIDAIKKLKEKGFWIAGTTLNERSEDYTKIAKDVPLVIVVGNEGEGMSKVVTNECDFLYHLPMLGKVQSLNVSVAAGIVMYERIKTDN